MVELILERARASRDDHVSAREQCRDEIRKRLAGAGAGFDHQGLECCERLANAASHLELLGTRCKARQAPGQRSFRAQNIVAVFHSEPTPGPTKLSDTLKCGHIGDDTVRQFRG